MAIAGDRFFAIGNDDELRGLAGPGTQIIDLAGAPVLPGLIDGHAHMDREGLKQSLPSLAAAISISDILEIIRGLVAASQPGQWIVTMPIGTPPAYEDAPGCLAEGRFPTRQELDSVAPDNPVYIRSIWGYWRPALPLVSVANSAALNAAGIDRNTRPPVDSVTIETDPSTGEPTGILVEHNKMPVVELSLMAAAPNFSPALRTDALATSMRLYNAVGTTGVFEGHGVAADVVSAYQALRHADRQTVRATLVFSPAWQSVAAAGIADMIRSWAKWLARKGMGDDWLRLQGIYTEVDASPETAIRAAARPQTGWAGFHYDSAIPEDDVKALLIEAVQSGLQVVGIFPYMLDLFADVARKHPIGDLRWVQGHLATLTDDQIRQMADLGIGVTTHTSAHIYKRGSDHLNQLGKARQDEIVPLRNLIEAGVPVSFGTDNVPISLFHSVWHAVARESRSGDVVAPSQALSPEEALRCASAGGAWMCFDEERRGTIEAGRLADAAILSADPLTCETADLKNIVAQSTIVGGRTVYRRESGN
jgi:predicted amidohydrolase YtcJ